MQGLQKGVVTAVLMAWCATSVADQKARADSFGYSEPVYPKTVIVAERSKRSISLFGASGINRSSHRITAPGASFIKLHFGQFRLPPGVSVEISSPDESESWRYSATERDSLTLNADLGDDGKTRFSAMSITGDTVNIRLVGNLSLLDPARHVVYVDSYLEGLPLGESKEIASSKSEFGDHEPMATDCGGDERWDAACWASSNSWEYKRSAAVAKLITSRGEVCTAWRVGSGNHLFTANHCLGKQSELDGAEIWFNYEAKSCGGTQNSTPVKVPGGSLLANSASLDYSLFTVGDFSSISEFPYFGLEVGSAGLGEEIFIPQHGLGRPRQIALESDMNDSGLCEVDALGLDGYASGSDIGYYCDTTTSSSGSPVVSNITGRVLAIHHFGGCMNAGVQISKIWPQVSGVFGGQVPSGGAGGGGGSTGNQSPSASISFECDGLSCTFDGSSSSDPDGSIDEFSWALGDGGTATGANIGHDFDEPGTYDITLTVMDDGGSSASKTQSVDVTITNQEPLAKFSAACVATVCDFNGAASSDPDGEVETWSWNLGDGTYGSGMSISHDYAEAGSYTVTLTVEDDLGATDKQLKTINLTAPNQKPVASFNFSCTELACSFDGGASSDPDGSVSNWNWTFGDGSSASGETVVHDFTAGGSYPVTLTVSDDKGATTGSSRNVVVSEPPKNANPVADFSFSCTGRDCSFDASGSSDADGDVGGWNWNFGDGSSASGKRVSHGFRSDGTFSVTVTVTDNEGANDSRSRNVAVSQAEEEPGQEPESNEAPLARFDYDCDELTCQFDAGPSRDPDGNLVNYQWSMGDGSTQDSMTVEYRFADSGRYRVTLTVRDDKGETDTRTSTIEVERARSVISLNGSGSRNNGRSLVTLHWSGALTKMVQLFRNGEPIATTVNNGKYVDWDFDELAKSTSYSLCEISTGNCSSPLVLKLGDR